MVICYVLTYASLLLALGRIGDTIGHAIVFRAGLICSAVALLLVSCAPSYGAMLVFRCLQGVGAALVMSCGVALVTSLYGEERRSRALGIYTMMMAIGLDARSPARRHLDGDLGLACGVLVPDSRSRSRRCCCCAACPWRRRA